MDVIPFVLSEEDVAKLPDNFLKALAECSTDVVKLKVKLYLKKDDANKEVQEKVRRNYEDVLRISDYLKNQDLAKEMERVSDLRYEDISPSLPAETLRMYKTSIRMILDNPDSMAYIPPIDGQLVNKLLGDMLDYSKKEPTIGPIIAKVKSHKDLFKDARTKRYVGTVMKKIMLNRQKFIIISEGIDFLLKKKEAGVPAEQWRIL